MAGSHLRRISSIAAVGSAAFVLALSAAVTAAAPAAASSAKATSCSTSNLAGGLTRVGHFAGVVRPGHTAATSCSGAIGKDPNSGDGTPPLIFHGGKMMSTTAVNDTVIITPIYWAPAGYSFASGYKSLINRYLTDSAHDSDKSTNVFSTLFEYNGSNGYINYRMQLGTPILDSTAYPAAGCTTNVGPVYSDNSGYSTCLDDQQVQNEINAQVTARGLKRNLGHMYVMFLPKHVESCFYAGNPVDQACTLNASPSAAYCAYHSEFNSNTVYANMPFPIYSSVIPFTCGSEATLPTNEAPNGNTDADVEISPLSHEISEAMSDPDTTTGWFDSSGYENGDECAYQYGATAGTAGALYNQTVNGHHYLTQEEFSNHNFNIGQGGCLQTYVPAATPTVKSMSSHAGTTAGGQSVTITGLTFGGATAVTFGTTTATFTIVDPTHIQVTTPAHAAGTFNVFVRNSLGSSAIVTADKYTFS